LTLAMAITYVNIGVICIALWGLLYYLIYLYSGRVGTWKPIAAFYVAYFVFLTWAIIRADAQSVETGPWQATIQYAHPIAEQPYFAAVIAFLIFPQLIAAAAYFLLAFRVDDAMARYRIVLVSMSIFVWFGLAFIGSAVGWTGLPAWLVTSRLIGLSAALTVFFAYKPPRFIERRLSAAA